jgi:CBS domain-containing protein
MYGHIANLLADKGRQVYTTRKSATVQDAVHDMNRKRVGALIVIDDQRPVGIFTERDVLRRVVDEDRDPALTHVVEVMTPDPTTAPPDLSVEEAMGIMTARRFRHLPVVEEGALVGIVSIGDLMRWVTIHQAEHIDRMAEYITGVEPHLPV